MSVSQGGNLFFFFQGGNLLMVTKSTQWFMMSTLNNGIGVSMQRQAEE